MMWGQKGGRSLITGNTPQAWLLRILLFVFLVGGTALIWRLVGAERAVASTILPDPLSAGWKDEKVCAVLHENDAVRTLRCVFPPGVGHERHFHAPHWGYIVDGATMRIVDEKGVAVRELQTGGSWWSDGVIWHEALNVGNTTGVYLIVEPKTAGS